MDPKEREKVCFVLFDLEEVGSIGSKLFYQKYPGKMRSTLQIDLDCVGDGDHIMLLPNRVVLKENPNLKMLLGGYFERAVFTNAKKKSSILRPPGEFLYLLINTVSDIASECPPFTRFRFWDYFSDESAVAGITSSTPPKTSVSSARRSTVTREPYNSKAPEISFQKAFRSICVRIAGTSRNILICPSAVSALYSDTWQTMPVTSLFSKIRKAI